MAARHGDHSPRCAAEHNLRQVQVPVRCLPCAALARYLCLLARHGSHRLVRRYKVAPRCLLPIGEECKNDKKSAKDAKSKPGGNKKPKKRKRKLAVAEPSRTVGEGDEEAGLSPMSRMAQAVHNHAYERAGVIPPWGEDGVPSRGQIAALQKERHAASQRYADMPLVAAGERRLETRGAAYADQSRCITVDVELLPPTPYVLYTYFSIFFIGTYPAVAAGAPLCW